MRGGHSFFIPALYLLKRQEPPTCAAVTPAGGVYGGPLYPRPSVQCVACMLRRQVLTPWVR